MLYLSVLASIRAFGRPYSVPCMVSDEGRLDKNPRLEISVVQHYVHDISSQIPILQYWHYLENSEFLDHLSDKYWPLSLKQH